MAILYWLVCLVLLVWLKLVRRLQVSGRENIPPEGPVIFAPNHTSYLDPFVLAPVILPRRLGFIAKKELFFFPLGPILKGFGAFPVDRSGDATGAVRTALTVLEDGLSLGIFPEGTRNHTEEPLLPLKRGVALMAARSGVPVVPVGISGSRGFTARIRIRFGTPLILVPDTPDGKVPREAYQEFLDRLQESILQLKSPNTPRIP